jgi:low affinity Fe/Cu permease
MTRSQCWTRADAVLRQLRGELIFFFRSFQLSINLPQTVALFVSVFLVNTLIQQVYVETITLVFH